MPFDWWTFALQTVNFAVLVWLLHRLLYKPVLRLLDARRAQLEALRAAARAEEEKARRERAEVDARLAGIAAEREARLHEATAQAEQAAAARREQAQREAQALLDATRRSLASERERALEEARTVALDLAQGMARRLLAEAGLEGEPNASLRHVERRLAALPEAERAALRAQLAGDGRLEVVTAATLAPEAADAWREAMRRALGTNATIGFATDAGIVAGAELRFPSAVLRLSWANALAQLRSEIEDDGLAR